ncbi:MAG: hypothetical protein Fur002_00790 [Anaerolineales bacterium]
MTNLTLYQEIFKHQKLDYALCDASRRVTEYSPGIMRYTQQRDAGPLRGQTIENLLDVLAGMEDDFDKVVQKKLPFVTVEKIYQRISSNESVYFSVYITPYQNGALVLIEDVTQEAELEQRVTQQRNQLDIISSQLAQSRSQLDDLLHRFIPSQIADQILLYPQVKLGGKKQVISALFADMRGFTGLSEWVEPDALLEILNQHFSILGQIVLAHGGVITNYAGDMLMAIFNALDDQPDHALRAAQAAIEIQRALSNLQNNPQQGMPFVFDFGIGVNSGENVVGFLGFENRFEYTAIGENINIASRLSGAASAGQILTTENVYQQINKKIETHALGNIQLRGHKEAVAAYEIITGASAQINQ